MAAKKVIRFKEVKCSKSHCNRNRAHLVTEKGRALAPFCHKHLPKRYRKYIAKAPTCGEVSGIRVWPMGELCQSHLINGHDTCLAHADKETKEKYGFTGNPKPPPKMREIIEARVMLEFDRFWKVIEDALVAEGAVVVGNGANAHIEFTPDHRVRLSAFKEAFDRGFGRPMQAAQVSGPEGGPVQLGLTGLAELAEKARRERESKQLDDGNTIEGTVRDE